MSMQAAFTAPPHQYIKITLTNGMTFMVAPGETETISGYEDVAITAVCCDAEGNEVSA